MEPSSLTKAVLSTISFTDGRSRRRVEAVLRIYMTLGIGASVLSGLYFAGRKLGIKIEPEDQVTLAIFATGLFIALISKLWLSFYVEKEKLIAEHFSTLDPVSTFLEEWREFERAAAHALGEVNNDRPVSPRDLISGLLEKNFITPEDASLIHDTMNIRNLIVHGSIDEIPEGVINRLQILISLIISKINIAIK